MSRTLLPAAVSRTDDSLRRLTTALQLACFYTSIAPQRLSKLLSNRHRPNPVQRESHTFPSPEKHALTLVPRFRHSLPLHLSRPLPHLRSLRGPPNSSLRIPPPPLHFPILLPLR